MNIPLLYDTVIIFGIAVAVLFLCHKFRIPSIIGFLITGFIAGPYGLGLVNEVHDIEVLAEIGVVLLLFTIGIEFSLKELLKMKKMVLAGGALQVTVTTILIYLLARQFDFSQPQSLFFGFLVALSSTAIVLRLLQEKAQIESPHGRTALSILIFQDIIIVPMILITPFLAGADNTSGTTALIMLGKAVLILAFVIVAAKWLIPSILFQVTKTRSSEFFLLTLVVICFGIAWLTSLAGLSLALGAFLAGLIISESEYSHHALDNIIPFKEIFTTFFFVSIGMMLDIFSFLAHPFTIIFSAMGIMFLKAIVIAIIVVSLGLPLRTALITGLSLCQIGEFSFVLSISGLEHSLLSQEMYQTFLAISITTMAATPFIMAVAPRIASFINNLPIPDSLARKDAVSQGELPAQVKDHLIIVGFGLTGRTVARAAKSAGIQYVIIEMNPETVRTERKNGEPIYYGDATRKAILNHLNIQGARLMIVAINDPVATRKTTGLSKQLNPKIHIIVRTRFILEMEPLYKIGADEVIAEEFETSIEIFARVLAKYLVPREEIEKAIARIRSEGYKMLREPLPAKSDGFRLMNIIHDLEITGIKIPADSAITGKTLGEIDIKKKFGAYVVAIRRGEKTILNPDAQAPVLHGDILFLLGEPDKIADTCRYISSDHKDDRNKRKT